MGTHAAGGAVELELVEFPSPVGSTKEELVPDGVIVTRVPPSPTDMTGFTVVEELGVDEEAANCVGVEVTIWRLDSRTRQKKGNGSTYQG